MSDPLRVLDCEFCAPPAAYPGSPLRLVANRIIGAHGEMLLVADHAPMTLGHLLLIPQDHHTGMASFVALKPCASATLYTFTRWYRRAFGKCSVIEHGTGAVASVAGACIDHAHWHLLPFGDELTPIVDGDYGRFMKRITSMEQFASDYAETDYLLYWSADNARATLLDTVARLPQYARSVVARHLDASAMPYDWDWALRADDELLVQTLTAARKAFGAVGDTEKKMASDNTTGISRDTFG